VKMEKKILNILVFHICFFLSISLISQTEFICRRVKQEGRVARLRSIFEWLRYRQAHPEQDVWALQRALDSGNIMAWVKDGMEMKRIISEIGDYGSAEEKNETVIFLLQMANPYEGPYVRKAAVYCLKELFPYLNGDTKRLILGRLEEEYIRYSQQIRLQGEERDTLRQFLGVISQFVPMLTEEEIQSINPVTLTAVAYYCAETLLESDIKVLSKVIRYVSPQSQKEALMSLRDAFIEEYNPVYQEEVGIAVVDLIINNLPHCNNPEFLEGAFELAVALLGDPATFECGKKIAYTLMPFLASSEKKQIQDLLKQD